MLPTAQAVLVLRDEILKKKRLVRAAYKEARREGMFLRGGDAR
jgi:hypothetical protein